MALRWPDAAAAERPRRGDHTILLVTLLLVAIGLGMIYSASGALADKRFGAHSYFLKRQLLWCAIGLVALLVVARCELVTRRRRAGPVLLLGLLAPRAVLVRSIEVAC